MPCRRKRPPAPWHEQEGGGEQDEQHLGVHGHPVRMGGQHGAGMLVEEELVDPQAHAEGVLDRGEEPEQPGADREQVAVLGQAPRSSSATASASVPSAAFVFIAV